MATRKASKISIEGARIGFLNFSGKEGNYNPAGRKNFCVFLESDLARTLQEDGWNIRWLKPRDEYEEEQAYLQVAVRFDNYPPKIIIKSSRGQTLLNEETVSLLDWADIEEVDLILSPGHWTMYKGTPNEKQGIKAYLKSMYVLIAEDEFEKKWADAPASAIDSIGGCGECEVCDGECEHN